MNLHGIAAPYVSAVNPMTLVGLRISIGPGPMQPNGKREPLYAAPGQFTGSITGNVLTVSQVFSGFFQVGQTIIGDGIPDGVLVESLFGGVGETGTYMLNRGDLNIPEALMRTTHMVLAQLQALSTRDLQQTEGLNLNGMLRALYINGGLDGTARPLLKGGDLVQLPDGGVWLVTTVPEPWVTTAGWTKAVITLQNDAVPSNIIPVVV